MLHDLGLNTISSIFQPVGLKQILGDRNSIHFLRHKAKIIAKGVFNELYNEDMYSYLESLKIEIVEEYKLYNFKALLLYTDQYFESKYLIDIFKVLKKPSFIFSHGLPGIYSLEVDNRSDYLMVWGEKIKQNYINAGFDPNKIVVTGNPKYTCVNKVENLRNTLGDILVIPCSSLLWHQDTWGNPQLIDRSMVVLYLYEVQRVLLKLGIKRARFRPHPSINRNWVYGFLDHNFYIMDNDKLTKSLLKSTLVIGATSTVFLEALMLGVNYLIYEPQEDNKNIMRCKTVSPFDGSDPEVNVIYTEQELEYAIRNKYQVNVNILDGYMEPLNLMALKNIIIT